MPKPAIVPALALLCALLAPALRQAMIHSSRVTTLAMTISLDPGRFAAEATVAGLRLALNLCWRSRAGRQTQ